MCTLRGSLVAAAISVGVLAATIDDLSWAEDGGSLSPAQRDALSYGRDLFQGWCGNCHLADPGKSPYAAPLDGLYGRMPGSYPGYEFTPQITRLGTAWSLDSLDAWLAAQATESPTTSIRHLGVSSPADRAAITAYIATLGRE